MRKRPLLVIEWDDTTSSSKWEDEGDADVKLARIHTVGWQLKKTREYILLTNQRDATYYQCSDRHKIPRGCIKNIRRLE